MKSDLIKFWGVRGSNPTTDDDKLEVGGDTSCVEIRTKENEIIILDMGTGLRNLGQALVKEKNPPIYQRLEDVENGVYWINLQSPTASKLHKKGVKKEANDLHRLFMKTTYKFNGFFVKMIRKAELIYGSSEKKILKSEHHKY